MKLECCLKLEDTISPQVSFKRFLKCNLYLGLMKKSNIKYPQLFIVTANNTLRYKILDNIRFIAKKDIAQGKATIGIHVPQHQLMINCESNKLMNFLKLLSKISHYNKLNINDIPIFTNVKKPTLKLSQIKNRIVPIKNELNEETIEKGHVILKFMKNHPRLWNALSQDLQKLELTGLKNIEFSYLVGRLPLVMVNLENTNLRNKDLNWLNEMPIRRSLKTLNLSRNKLTSFPDAVIDCSSLDILNLSQNNISILPNGICRLQKLRVLNLSRNSLRFLPADITRLKLETLDLTYNHLTSNVADHLVTGNISNFRQELRLTDWAAMQVEPVTRYQLSTQDCPAELLRQIRSLSKCICGKTSIAKTDTEYYVPLNNFTFSVSTWISPQNELSSDSYPIYLQYHFCSFRNNCNDKKFRLLYNCQNCFQMIPILSKSV